MNDGHSFEDSLHGLTDLVRAFAQARNWEQYHTPKNLAMALAGEVGELIACFQWLTPGESTRIMQDSATATAVELELADVLQYLIRLADVLDVDLAEAVRKKVRINEDRFPPNRIAVQQTSTPGRTIRPEKEPFVVLNIAGRPASYSSVAQGPWQAAVRSEISRHHVPLRDSRFGIRIEFRTPVPTSANDVWDIDNLIKPTLDAMEGVLGLRLWRGSAQVADDRVDYIEASKRTIRGTESPGASIAVYDLGEA